IWSLVSAAGRFVLCLLVGFDPALPRANGRARGLDRLVRVEPEAHALFAEYPVGQSPQIFGATNAILVRKHVLSVDHPVKNTSLSAAMGFDHGGAASNPYSFTFKQVRE